MSILLYGGTKWTLTKCIEKKLDGNCTRMLWAVLNKSWQQHPTKQQLYGHLPHISKTIQLRWIRQYWRRKDELISNIFLWIPTHEHASDGQPARTYLHQLCADTWYSLENLLGGMDNRNKWRHSQGNLG